MASAILSSLKYVSIQELVNKADFYNPNLSTKTEEGKILESDKVENPFYVNNR